MTDKPSSILTHLMSLPTSEQVSTLMRCCGSSQWAQKLTAQLQKLTHDEALYECSDQIWSALTREDYLEAFSHHPQIGANLTELRKRFASTSDWSAGEQSGMNTANEDTIERLALGNTRYLDKFGYIFIVCATGKSAKEMLTLLESRLPNDPNIELEIAAREQAKITRIRLEKLL